MAQVGIIMGSKSDLPVMQDAADVLKELGVSYEINIVSAHRTPDLMYDYAKTAHEKGLQVIIAGAGGAAHLPGMTASLSPLPVIGVPVKSRNSIDGWDSMLSILQMPNGILSKPSKYCLALEPESSVFALTSFSFNIAFSLTVSFAFNKQICCSIGILFVSKLERFLVYFIVQFIASRKYLLIFHGRLSNNIVWFSVSNVPLESLDNKSYNKYDKY